MTAAEPLECEPYRHPCENLTEGLYLDPRLTVTTISTTVRDPGRSVFAEPEVTESYLVSAEDFMAVQKERDAYRRVVALVNAWRITPNRSEARLRDLLAAVGQGDGEGEATLSILYGLEEYRRDRSL